MASGPAKRIILPWHATKRSFWARTAVQQLRGGQKGVALNVCSEQGERFMVTVFLSIRVFFFFLQALWDV